MRNGGKILIDGLATQGVTAVFTVPGESFLPALDALRDCVAIRTVVCRHEGGAAMMAEAAARLSGRLTVALVTRAPGAANAVSGVVCAAASRAPLLLVVGLPRSDMMGRDGAFQDIDVEAVFGSLAKWVGVCRDPARIAEHVTRAARTALSGEPGPVVLGIPQDVLAVTTEVPPPELPAGELPALVPDPDGLARLSEALAEAQHPVMIVGGPGWTPAARAALHDFATAFDLPVAAAFRCQDAFDNRHPGYVGHCGIAPSRTLAGAIRAADLVILAGARADEITTGGWRLIGSPAAASASSRRVIAIARDAAAAASLPAADLVLLATPETLAPALARLTPSWRAPDTGGTAAPWAAWRRDLKAAWRASLDLPPPPSQLPAVFAALSEMLPPDAVICGGAGNYAAFLHRYFVFKDAGTSLSPPSGSMGYGLPAAIAASLHALDVEAHGRQVVAVAGDGCFLMTAQELATAAQYGARLIVVVVNNGLYGTIRMQQELSFPGRAFATRLANPDLVALAASFGAHAVRVADAGAFRAALADCLPRDGVRFIEVVADADEIAPEIRLSSLSPKS